MTGREDVEWLAPRSLGEALALRARLGEDATVVAGGLLMATFLTLFVIPTFYFVVERRAMRYARATETQPAGSSA